ncbi:MAG: hypothetical protein AB1507_07985 [Bacillota bacterium]|nr:hypothetical protein [Thermoanaerobacteraceae bacterium]
MDIENRLGAEQRRKLKQFSTLATAIVAVATLLAFWAGLYLLQHDVFKNYYNPDRHVILQQDPETLEVYAWKDAAGRVFTRDSATVRLFPYGVMVLILLLLGFGSALYNFLTQAYASRLLRGVVPEAPLAAGSGSEPYFGRQRPAARG